MATVIFNFNGINTKIQCKKEDKMENILNKFKSKIEKNINTLFFLYNGNQINIDLTFNEQANLEDKNKNEMNVLVFEKEKNANLQKELKLSKVIICPKCNENCRINIQNYKVKLYECKNNHEINNILLNEYYNTQNINESNIICENCNKINKYTSYNNQFFICLTCKKNICPLCKSNHQKRHKIIDYERKNYVCNIHNDSYISFCNECKKNLCMQCEIEHDKHEKIFYKNILPNEKEINDIIKDYRKKID